MKAAVYEGKEQIRIVDIPKPTHGYLREDSELSIDLVARKLINPEPIVTKVVSLDDIVEEGFKCAIEPETKEIKILVKP